jgi:hypothetical protein
VIVTVMITAAMLPVLKLIPRELVVTADGERGPAVS